LSRKRLRRRRRKTLDRREGGSETANGKEENSVSTAVRRNLDMSEKGSSSRVSRTSSKR